MSATHPHFPAGTGDVFGNFIHLFEVKVANSWMPYGPVCRKMCILKYKTTT